MSPADIDSTIETRNAASPDETAEFDGERLAVVRLALTSGVGPLIARNLLDRFGSAAAVFDGNSSSWSEVPKVGPKIVAALSDGGTLEEAKRELRRCRESDVRVLIEADDGYPASLRQIPDAPPMLSMRGRLTEADRIAVGIVGSRTCSLYGRQTAEMLARGLARAGVTVISGLARGIDAAAHRGALDAGGRTIAVTAGGLAKLYPPEHIDLARQIVEAGAVLTESPLDRDPTRGLFPQRNRIISGLCGGVILVEATLKSGALHTARHAKEQDRDVFAVPGPINAPTSEGTNNLLRDGAILVRGVDDVLEMLGPLPEAVQTETASGETQTTLGPRELQLSDFERRVLEAIPTQPTLLDDIATPLIASGLTASQVMSTVMLLEVRRFVAKQPGGYVQRVPG